MMIEPIKTWFNNLLLREQKIVLTGGIIFFILFFYMALWNPLSTAVSNYKIKVRSEEQLLCYMQKALVRIQTLKASGAQIGTEQGDLLTVAEQTLTAKNLSSFLKQVQQPQHNQIDLTFENVPFDQLMLWLQALSAQYGVRVVQLSAARLPIVGAANVTMLLTYS
ncbi:MAG: type II secretion system protein M [Gammaproteobacteria bacterium]|nr:type II secretion system protein M [Gammaproteobacteria bacterium]